MNSAFPRPTPSSSPLRTFRLVATSLSLAVALLSSGSAWANGLPKTSPEKVGMSSERLARIGSAMEEHVRDQTMSGALGMIARNGQVVYSQSWGESDREAHRKMTEDTIFRIYSMSKPITSVAVMMLYEEGKIMLTDPIGKYIPELAKLQVATKSADGEGDDQAMRASRGPVTVRDLMRHTAGMTYGFFGNSAVDQQYRHAGILLTDRDLEQFVSKLSEIPLQYEPGTRWHYSVSVDVLGRLVEVVSGKTFAEFLQERIFDPLHMVDTGFWVPMDKRDRFAQLYSPEGTADGAEAWLQQTTGETIMVAPKTASLNFLGPKAPTFFSGGGGMVSTVNDYMRFCLMMLNGGELDGARLLSPKTIELMTADHTAILDNGMGRPGYGFGLGFAVSHGPGELGEYTSPGEYNWGGAAGTRFWIDPEEKLIGIFMVQILPHRTSLGTEFRNLTYQSLLD